ncbi:HAD family hydrolase [Neptunicella marina]|uniref:HAD family phosphatase n=1 Tax=Neptunicella marina TaxID=2125989 RepID=A0A8J6M5I2_9ALTE|nr:HAD family phosphatase [Neptunicella marina]MBC3766536.1 HAD family phosphatase [Neptunicella marina]
MQNHIQFDAILFDKDGTIFDSEALSCEAWVETAKRFNVEFTPEMFHEFIGVPTDECYRMAHRRFGADFPMQDFIKYNRAYINDAKAKGLPQKAGFSQFFDFAKQLNIPLGLVTSAGKESTMLSFQRTDFARYFDTMITVEDVKNPKPAADCYLLACKQLSVDPKRTVVFEDSNPGIEAAIAAGCYTVAIPDTLPVSPELAGQCQHILSSFDDAYQIFR